jgi:uncharacterized membrane protein (DUF485 family)
MTILIDGLIGGIICAFISFIANNNNNTNFNTYLKIFAYLWAAPIFYVYIIFILLKSKNKSQLKGFVTHALFGAILSVILLLSTYILIKMNVKNITNMIFNIVFAILCIVIYLTCRLYRF